MRMRLVIAAVVACGGMFAVTKLSAQRPAAPGGGATALVDFGAIMKESTRFKQSMDHLKQEYEAKAAELKREGDLGNQLTEELRKMAPNDPKKKELEQDIMKRRADYDLHGKRMTEEIRDQESKIVLGLLGDVKGELARYAKARGTQLILRFDPTPENLTDPRVILREIHKPIVYQRGVDITPLILNAHNGGAARRAPAAAPRTGRAPVPSRGVPR